MVKLYVKYRIEIISAMLVSILLFIILIKLFTPITIDFLLWVYSILITSCLLVIFTTAYLKYEDPSEGVYIEDFKVLPLISVIIAVKNEEILIKDCVKSFINQDYKNKEIIIVNDGSTDNTLKVLKELQKKEDITIVNLKENVGKKKALERGVRIAKGEIFVFSDSDSIAENNAVTQLIKVFLKDNTIGAVTGHGSALNYDKNILTKIQDTWYDGQFRVMKGMESYFGAVTCCSGCLSAFRKVAILPFISSWANDVFLGAEFKGATDRQLTGYILNGKYSLSKMDDADDRAMTTYSLIDWKVKYCESAKVKTEVPDTFKKLLRQQIRWKKNFIRNLFFTGLFYWRKNIVVSTIWYLGVLFTFISPFIAVRSLIYLPLFTRDIYTPLFYLSGILMIGMIFAVDYKIANPNNNRWIYRPLMSLMSTFILSWLLFYSLITIRRYSWLTR